MDKPVTENTVDREGRNRLFAVTVGIFVALGILKFGNPVILADKVAAPESFLEWIYQTWPIEWAYIGLLPVLLFGWRTGRWKKLHPILFLPAIWLGWQFISATQSVSPTLTTLTLKHFTACVVCFYLGWFALAEAVPFSPPDQNRPLSIPISHALLWFPILLGLAWVVRTGFEQHFGGLEAARRHFEIYVLPTLKEPPPEGLVKKLATGRIFSTVFYPNTLAGVLLFLTPTCLVVLWQTLRKLALPSRVLLTSLYGLAGLACLFWSGSKSGWLLALVLVAMALLQSAISGKTKKMLVTGIILVGLAGFALKYAGFFAKGATSVVARTDYWKAAIHTFVHHPILGTGPGTFSVPYAAIKSPEAEMARLCHNDFLEQASDSGLIGFLSYSSLILGAFYLLYRHRNLKKSPILLAILLGLTVLNLQSLTEFNLYIPAVAWPNFLFLGWLTGLATAKPVDNPPPSR